MPAEASGSKSPAASPEAGGTSHPMRYRQRGHCRLSHRRTSLALPQQQSKHFMRMALPLVIRSPKLIPQPEHRPQQKQRIPVVSFWGGGISLCWR